MRKTVIISAVCTVACLTPAAAFAQATSDLKLNIMPKECTVESVSDGSTQTSYLSPEECQELLNPTPKPRPSAGPAGGGAGSAKPAQNTPTRPNSGEVQGARTVNRAADGSTPTGEASGLQRFSGVNATLDAIARWVDGTKTVFISAAPYAMASVLVMTALLAVDAMLNQFIYTKWVVRRVRQPAKSVKKLIRRPRP